MQDAFSFDRKGVWDILKIGALIAVIFISFDFGSRQGQDLLAAASALKIQKGKPAAPVPKIKNPPSGSALSLLSTSTASAVYFRKTNLPANVPVVEGAGAIAVDLETGAILFEKNKDDIYPTASLAKLMTAVIAQETFASSTIITAGSDSVSTYGNSGGIVRGESFRVSDLLYGLLLPSSNDASRMFELAQDPLRHPPAGGADGGFVSAMNAKAASLGMTRTSYVDSSGLKQDTASSAADLVKLLRYIYLKHPEIAAASRTRQHSVVSGGRKIRHIWDNINWPAGDKKFLGGKAGFTDEAIETMAGIWSVNPSQSGNRPIGIAILGSRHRVSDTRAIIRYIENRFVYGTTTPLTHDAPKPGIIFSGAALLEAVKEYLR
ncbi:MAG: D-alanyl-D-alanine carboxypeptidase [Candidatus Sungbacteria bacterium]|nr:D-alanyl-D-alanine carboxypeptidase [Candidatus Sungbacteria bacterium]